MSVFQLSMSVGTSPTMNGFPRRSCRSVLVGARRSQTSGTRKNNAKTDSSSAASARASQARGDTTYRAPSPGRLLGTLKEATAEDEEHAQDDCNDQENQRDRCRAVEVALLEGIKKRELVE